MTTFRIISVHILALITLLLCLGVSALSAGGIPAPTNHRPRGSENSESEIDFGIAPVYITIGPPCCGKTEALRSYLFSEGYDPDDAFSNDVALHDQSKVYHRIPLAAFLFPTTQLDPAIGNQLLKSGSTVRDRLTDPSYDSTDEELRSVMLRIAGRITPQEFADQARQQALRAGDTVKFFQKRRMAVAEDLVMAVEQAVVQAVSEVICQMQLKRDIQSEQEELPYHDEENRSDTKQEEMPSTMNATEAHLISARALIGTSFVELFVPQAIFRGGIDRAKQVFCDLLESCPGQPVSWGNTNTRPTEFEDALSAAQKAGRPVKFIAWGTSRLPIVSRQELLRRNVARFRNTGRYIPAGAIGAALGRVEKLVNDAQQQADKLFEGKSCPREDVDAEEWESLKMDAGIASLAGFQMDECGFVVRVGEPKGFRQKSSKNKKTANNLT